MTTYGGACCGTVFKIEMNGAKTVLYNFMGGEDGGYPSGGLLRDSTGNLYGTTQYGGKLGCNAPVGCGTVFQLHTDGTLKTLYRFSGPEGLSPNAGLIRDPGGNLYGTTLLGGTIPCGDGRGCGTVFKLDRNGVETVLYRFTGMGDGKYPVTALTRDTAGVLYGTTTEGGASDCDCGVVFKITP